MHKNVTKQIFHTGSIKLLIVQFPDAVCTAAINKLACQLLKYALKTLALPAVNQEVFRTHTTKNVPPHAF